MSRPLDVSAPPAGAHQAKEPAARPRKQGVRARPPRPRRVEGPSSWICVAMKLRAKSASRAPWGSGQVVAPVRGGSLKG